MASDGRKRLTSFAQTVHRCQPALATPGGALGGDLRATVSKEAGDLGGKLILRIGLTQAPYVEAVSVFRASVSCRQKNRQPRALPTHFADKFDAGHSRHRVVGYQKICIQSAIKEMERLSRRMRFDHLMSQVFEQGNGAAGDEGIVVHEKYFCPRRGSTNAVLLLLGVR